ncbi:hypothetical protein [Pseudogemmobacter sonorensis]|uniref:hypothetical protein n=1 Tax=Pseudogemmobacter sonorensis TaxID=2989681 RepID=UPI003F668743
MIRAGITAFTYTRPVQPRPKLGAWAGELNRLLEVNAARASRERQSLAQIDEEPSGLGYGGGYDAVRRNASNRARNQGPGASAAFAPLRFARGEACQFDWSHEVVVIDGARTIKAAHVRLCRSRTFFVRADPRATQEPRPSGSERWRRAGFDVRRPRQGLRLLQGHPSRPLAIGLEPMAPRWLDVETGNDSRRIETRA